MLGETVPQARGTPEFPSGGGVTGALVRALDWSQTPLGPLSEWPASLRTTVGTLLNSRHPMFLWWGPELVQIYNDAYLPSFGQGKHPAAMGQRGRDCWQEIWPIISLQIDDVMKRAQPSWNEDHLVPIFRNGRIEEVYWTYGYSPVFGEDGKVAGTLVVCTETTSRVISLRRQATLRVLDEKAALATELPALLHSAAEAMAQAPEDIPFAMVYAKDAADAEPRIAASVGLPPGPALEILQQVFARPTVWAGLGDAASLRQLCPTSLPDLPGGPWLEPATAMFVTPLIKSGASQAFGFVIFGLSPRLPWDGAYREHLEQVTKHLGVAHARIEASRIRAAVIAERNSLLLQAPVATALLTGPDHVFELANPLFTEMVGDRELVGRSYAQAFPEPAAGSLLEILDRVFRTGLPYRTNELHLPLDRGSDGTFDDRFFKFNLEPLRDAHGAVYGMMAVAVDLTAQVAARRALEKAHDERATLLNELESASRAKDEFLAMLGHELRNPLSPIVTALQLMRLRGESQSTKEQAIIERQVSHLVRLVDDLLDVSKITRGKVELCMESIEISEAIGKAVEMASFLFEQRGHRLQIDVPRTDLRWVGDPVRLAQVVANLLTNAARYTERDGLVQVSAAREDQTIVIRVKDNGIGISAEMLPRIFDLFTQGKRSADRNEGGLGIGLALVKNLVAMHGGTVTAVSAGRGQGSEFTIRLPQSGVGSPLAPAPAPALRAPAPRKRVLVVDDNVDAAEMLAELLRASGHDVTTANDPLVALELSVTLRPEVGVFDIGLPGMDGYDLAARLRANPLTSNCRMIALTGYGQEHDRRRSAADGFEHHLVKPVDVDKLLLMVAELGDSGAATTG